MGFFDKLSGFLSGAADVIGNSARRSDNPEVVMNYLNLFDQRVDRGDLEQLERMLEQREYEVRLDSVNDYQRRQRIEERLVVLRQARDQEISASRKSFDKWLSQSGLEELEKGLSTKRYQIPYDSRQDTHRRTQLEKQLRLMAQESFDRWLSQSGLEELERGLSAGRYQIPYDSDKDALRQAQLEEKLRPLPEEQKQKQIHRTEQLFREYLDSMESELYRSFNALRDFQQELSYLPDYQQAILDVRYKENVDALMSMPEQAVSCFHSAAEQGEADAQFYLGYCFEWGYGFSCSEKQAFRWYRQSAQQHNALGLLGLGWCYQSGIGVEKDENRALDCFRESQSLGCAEASDELGNMAESCGDSAAAFRWYQKAASDGSLSGKIHYFEYLYNGNGVDKAQDTAFVELEELLDLVQADSVLDQLAAGSALNYIANMLEDEDLVHAYYSYDMNS